MDWFHYEIIRSKTSLRLSFFSSLAPSIRHDNSSPFRVIVISPSDDGQRKCPRSRRLKYNQKPSPSHSRIFRRSRFRLQNTNSASGKAMLHERHQPVDRFSHICMPAAKVYRFPAKLHHSDLSARQTFTNSSRSVSAVALIRHPLTSTLRIPAVTGSLSASCVQPFGTSPFFWL